MRIRRGDYAMRFAAIVVVSAGVGLLAFGRPAHAQQQLWPQFGNMAPTQNLRGPQGFPNQPALSPWLNLTRGGNPAANLYLGVYPEFDRRYFQGGVMSTLPTLENSIQALQQPQDIIGGPALNQTGHLSAFQAYGTYYNMPGQQRTFYPLNPNQARNLPR
jgi:hypothetical protein